MRPFKALFLSLLLSLITFPSLQAQNSNRQCQQKLVYGVAFYNLENLFDTINNNGKYDLEYSPKGRNGWNSERYWSKINHLASAIAAMKSPETPFGPAVIGVAEIENSSVMNDLVNVDFLKKWDLKYVHHDSPDRRGVDVGLIYNPTMFHVIDVTNHTLIVPSNPTFKTRDQMCVTGMLGRDTVSIIVNHWPSRLGGQEESSYLRQAAASLSRHIADSLWTLRPDQGIIIMGDLNDDPFDTSVAMTLGGRPEEQGIPLHGFFNPWWRILYSGKGTLSYKGRWNLFDQILVSGTLLPIHCTSAHDLHYVDAKVCDFDFLKNPAGTPFAGTPHRTFARGEWLDGYSDHFPTEIFLQTVISR